MNDRIQDLAYDAEDYAAAVVDERSWPVDGGSGFHPIFVKKFAELIVKECVGVVEAQSDRYRNEYFAQKIREHFGVEQ